MKWAVLVGCLGVLGCSDADAPLDGGSDAFADATDGVLDAGTPRCAVDGGGSNDPAALPAFGFFAGEAATGDVCLGGAFAVVRDSLLVIETGDFGDVSTFFRFQSPATATTGSLAIVVGLTSAAPGTYSSHGACGDLGFCAIMPAPVVDCGDAAAPSTCPAGCDFVEPGGPCGPVTPGSCFVARGTSDCDGTTTTPAGSWDLVITSLVPFADDASAVNELAAHGVLRAVLARDDATTTTLTLGF